MALKSCFWSFQKPKEDRIKKTRDVFDLLSKSGSRKRRPYSSDRIEKARDVFDLPSKSGSRKRRHNSSDRIEKARDVFDLPSKSGSRKRRHNSSDRIEKARDVFDLPSKSGSRKRRHNSSDKIEKARDDFDLPSRSGSIKRRQYSSSSELVDDTQDMDWIPGQDDVPSSEASRTSPFHEDISEEYADQNTNSLINLDTDTVKGASAAKTKDKTYSRFVNKCAEQSSELDKNTQEMDWIPGQDDVSSSSTEASRTSPFHVDNSEESDGDQNTNSLINLDKLVYSDSVKGASEVNTKEVTNNTFVNDSEKQEDLLKPNKLSVIKNSNKIGKRKWDKRHCCLYCQNHYCKMARHLEQVHKTEVEVAEIICLPKNSALRKAKWRELMNKGDFIYNKSILEKGEGKLIPTKRPATEMDVFEFASCDDCLGLYMKKDIWRHKKNCRKQIDQSSKRQRNSNLLFMTTDQTLSETFTNTILNKMSANLTSLIAKNDDLLLKFGKSLFSKCQHQPHQHQYVRQKMRELAKFLCEMRKELKEETLQLVDCIHPQKFVNVISAVKRASHFDGTSSYGTPSLALKLGQKVCKHFEVICYSKL